MNFGERPVGLFLGKLVVLVLLAGCDVSDRPPAVVHVLVSVKSDHLIVKYQLPYPMHDINLDLATPEVFGDSWTLLTTDLVWEGWEIEHVRRHDRGSDRSALGMMDESFKFDHFAFEVRADPTVPDRQRQAVTFDRFGGFKLLPSIFGSESKYITIIHISGSKYLVGPLGLKQLGADGFVTSSEDALWDEYVRFGKLPEPTRSTVFGD